MNLCAYITPPCAASQRLIGAVLLCLPVALAAGDGEPSREPNIPNPPANALVKPILPVLTTQPPKDGVQWRPLIAQSIRFLMLENAFRYATEPGTRDPGIPVFAGYEAAVNGLHGWADGDSFIVNYVGHPMQGSVAGFIWVQNDLRYRHTEFGRNREYWRSRLRAAAFSWAYSEQFEIGPLSEAPLGGVQAFFPQQGFVDHVITPAVGLGWMLAEDSMDRYFLRWFEERTDNPYYKLLLRGALNPARSLANVLGGRVPWYRDTRQGAFVRGYRREPRLVEGSERREFPAVAPFELTVAPRLELPLGGRAAGPCIGGGATAAFRLSQDLRWLLDVGGCKMSGLGPHLSGDNLTFLTGPRWSASPARRWNPYLQVLIGGAKTTTEEMFSAKKAALEAAAEEQGTTLTFSDHWKYTQQNSTAGLAFSIGAGIEKKLTSAIALRLASLDYTHAWVSRAEGPGAANNLQIGGGLILRVGTW